MAAQARAAAFSKQQGGRPSSAPPAASTRLAALAERVRAKEAAARAAPAESHGGARQQEASPPEATRGAPWSYEHFHGRAELRPRVPTATGGPSSVGAARVRSQRGGKDAAGSPGRNMAEAAERSEAAGQAAAADCAVNDGEAVSRRTQPQKIDQVSFTHSMAQLQTTP